MAISVYEQLNNMGLNIDRTTLQQVSQSILTRAAQKNAHYNVENAVNFFQPRDLGVDLYNGKVDPATAKQIALTNSGLQIQLNQNTINSIQYLNSMAAQNLQKNVEGKMTISVNEITVKEQNTPHTVFGGLVSQETAKDKNGSNPFYHGELLMNNGAKKDENKGDDVRAITTSVFA